jgi:hypothetical protein
VRDVRRYLLVDAKSLHDLPVASVTRKRVAGLLNDMATRAPVAADRCRVALSTLFTWAMKQGRPAPRGGRRHGVGRDRRQGHREGGLEPAGGPDEERGRPHDVPLSTAAQALLERQPKRDGRALVFGIGQGGFSGWSKGKAELDARTAATRASAAGRVEPIAEDALPPWRLHDLRRSVVTHMAEIGIQPHVIEAVVNRISGPKAGVAGVYNLATYSAEKRMALQAWADHLDRILGAREPR